MEDFLGAILGMIFEIVGEFLAELILAALADLLSRLLRRFFVDLYRMGPVLSGVLIALAGCAAGLISIGAFPHPIFPPRRFHGVSLLISPIAAGFGMSLIGWMVRRRGGRRSRIETFRYGFVFALAMAIVRFALVTRH